jgi:hypothetical protein
MYDKKSVDGESKEGPMEYLKKTIDPVLAPMVRNALDTRAPRTTETFLTARQDAHVEANIPGGLTHLDDCQSIYLVRHAYKEDMKAGFDASKTWQRPTDTPLSYEGTIMAMETGSLFSALNLRGKVQHVLASPSLRCLQTANPICEALGLEMCIEEGLYEMPLGTMYAESGLMPDIATAWDYPTVPFPTLAERKCYFTNVNMDYESKVKVASKEETFPEYFKVRVHGSKYDN